jgi:hypothetical protein
MKILSNFVVFFIVFIFSLQKDCNAEGKTQQIKFISFFIFTAFEQIVLIEEQSLMDEKTLGVIFFGKRRHLS